MSALNSGMDIVIELSDRFFERIIRKEFGKHRICFGGTFNVSLFGEEAAPHEVREVIPVIREDRIDGSAVALRQDGNEVKIDLHLQLMYGELNAEGLGWIDIDGREVSFTIGLTSGFDADGNAELQVDTSGLPDEVQRSIGEISIPIPLDFLTQRATAPDAEVALPPAPPPPPVILSAATTRNIWLKVIDEPRPGEGLPPKHHLLLGLDVSFFQDQDTLLSHGFRLNPDLEASDDPGGTPIICELPPEPEVDPARFPSFAESFLEDNEWAIALDAHVVDVMLRGSSISINRSESPTGDCAHERGIRFACLKLGGLRDGLVIADGEFSAYSCPSAPAPDAWYVVCITAEVTLDVFDGLRAHYRILHAAFCGSDADIICFNAFDSIPESDREGDITVLSGTTLGDAASSIGELRISNVEIHSNALLIHGIGLLTAPNPVIHVSGPVRFATACAVDVPVEEVFTISRSGTAPLHICPLKISGEHADRFSIVAPALREDGDGLTLFPEADLSVRVHLDGEPGHVYSANIVIPNNASRGVEVALNADLREISNSVFPEELSFTRTDYMALCAETHELFPTLHQGVRVTNTGSGYLRFCSAEFTPSPASPGTTGVFRLYGRWPSTILASGEEWSIGVEFNPGESGIGEEFRGTLRILTNGAPLEVALVGRIDRTTDWDSHGISGSFAGGAFAGSFADAYGFFCGMVDWKAVREGIRLLDPPEMDEFLPLLGGRACCPPPTTPVCLCADFLELGFKQVPRGVDLSVLDESGKAIFTDKARLPTRVMIVPINKDKRYALQSKLSQSAIKAPTSPLIMKRWIAQQEGTYETNRTLYDLAVFGKYAYAASPDGIEVVSLANFEKPAQIGLVKTSHQVVSLALFKHYLIAAGDGLEIFSLAEPENLKSLSSLNSVSGIKTLIATRADGRPLLLPYAIGQHTHVLDLSDPRLPKVIDRFSTRIQANQALVRSNNAYLFGKGGLEILDLSKPRQPTTLGLFSTLKEVRNGLVLGPYALLVYSDEEIDLIDVSRPHKLQLAGELRLEPWFKEYVPLSGGWTKSRGHFLVMKGDQHGIRMMRLLRNGVDKDKLLKRRSQRLQGALPDNLLEKRID